MKTAPVRATHPAPSAVPQTICFRLDADGRREMAARAAKLGVSPHDLARLYVEERLKQITDPAELMKGLQSVYQELRAARIDVALGVEVLLSSAGDVREPEARAWVKKNYPILCFRSQRP